MKRVTSLQMGRYLYGRINIGDANLIKQPSRRQPFAKQDEASLILNEMLQNDIIEVINRPWSAPIV